MTEKSKEDFDKQIKTSEWSMTLMNDLGFNLYIAPWSLVIRLVTYFEIEESCQNRGSKEVK